MAARFTRKYIEYIHSDAWAARRAEYFKNYRRKCSACGSKKNIHLHHLTYARMGEETDADLMPLCETCHGKVHKAHRNDPRISLRDATLRYVTARKRGAWTGVSKRRKREKKPKAARPVSRAGRNDPVNKAFHEMAQARRKASLR